MDKDNNFKNFTVSQLRQHLLDRAGLVACCRAARLLNLQPRAKPAEYDKELENQRLS